MAPERRDQRDQPERRGESREIVEGWIPTLTNAKNQEPQNQNRDDHRFAE